MAAPTHEMLTAKTVSDYLRSRACLSERLDLATTRVEVVDDVNPDQLVFVCTDQSGSSLALRQTKPTEPTAAERTRAHVLGLTEAANASPATAPALYEYDERQQVVAVEDLTRLTNWRTMLLDGEITRGVGAEAGRHIARLSFHTSAYRRSIGELPAHRVSNPAACGRTERSVFVDPYIADAHRPTGIADQLVKMADEPAVRSEVTRLRIEFLTRAESMVHGDLTPSSLVVDAAGGRAARIKVLDVGCGFHGPVAFDIGTLVGGVLVAFASALAMGRTEQAEWLRGVPAGLWRGFEKEFLSLWSTRSDDSFDEDQGSAWLDRVGTDVVGFAGCEAIRRIAIADPMIARLPLEPQEMAGSAVLSTAEQWLSEPGGLPDDDLFLTLGPQGRP